MTNFSFTLYTTGDKTSSYLLKHKLFKPNGALALFSNDHPLIFLSVSVYARVGLESHKCKLSQVCVNGDPPVLRRLSESIQRTTKLENERNTRRRVLPVESRWQSLVHALLRWCIQECRLNIKLNDFQVQCSCHY